MTLYGVRPRIYENGNLEDPLSKIVPIMEVKLPGKPENVLKEVVQKEKNIASMRKEVKLAYDNVFDDKIIAQNPDRYQPEFVREAVLKFNKKKNIKNKYVRRIRARSEAIKECYKSRKELLDKDSISITDGFDKLKALYSKEV